ncbi:hypothetical protein CR513_18678, partial [Mucuna pruriens]
MAKNVMKISSVMIMIMIIVGFVQAGYDPQFAPTKSNNTHGLVSNAASKPIRDEFINGLRDKLLTDWVIGDKLSDRLPNPSPRLPDLEERERKPARRRSNVEDTHGAKFEKAGSCSD